jgi:hypothetical protein
MVIVKSSNGGKLSFFLDVFFALRSWCMNPTVRETSVLNNFDFTTFGH